MDKKNDTEEMDKMPIPQKKEGTTFASSVKRKVDHCDSQKIDHPKAVLFIT